MKIDFAYRVGLQIVVQSVKNENHVQKLSKNRLAEHL